ncbi:MAG: hypothetical protein LBG48_03320 [Rickettsiales bacterium]|nr:hypothetical protein [Rickettsiales bacterium]
MLSIIILDCGVSSLRFDCISFVSPKRTNTAMTERWSRGLTPNLGKNPCKIILSHYHLSK